MCNFQHVTSPATNAWDPGKEMHRHEKKE
jgi:hypothetical protein